MGADMGQKAPFDGKTILIVEGEAIVRFGLAEFFEDSGYRVFEAESASDAIEVLGRHAAIRVVLLDVEIKGSMNGIRLAHYIRERHPPTRLVVTSGGRAVAQSELPEQTFFLPKPIDAHRLLRKMENWNSQIL